MSLKTIHHPTLLMTGKRLIEGFQSSFDEDFINDTFESMKDKIDGLLEKYE